MENVHLISNVITDLALIVRNKRGHDAQKVLSNFVGYLGSWLVFFINNIFSIKITQKTFWGYRWSFFNYEQFLSLISHDFVRNDYFFETQNSKPTIIDCGANIGDSVIYFKDLYPQAKIIAFEPDQKTFAKLKQNVGENCLKNVTLQNRAVSNKNGKTKFYVEEDNLGVGIMSLNKNRLNGRAQTVETVKLSTHIKTQIDFLKLDVEGEETKVLEELAQSKKISLINQMIIEYHHHIIDTKNSLTEILQILDQNGFDYQFNSDLKTPFIKNIFQDVLIFAYKTPLSFRA